ncbi:MAG: aminodeoxychorismate/anthranilate synthase component II [Flavobacteriaceae bacterium]|jgi:anthranilate synthase component II|nr:aminodeoxychorismate/anthranilate synthase component II [Flavobacteriaceae bacterium]
MKEIFVIDNYDSFTYNLVHCIEELGYKTTVKRNDKFELNELEDFQNILLSPGPGIPDESGLLKNAIKHYSSTKKILGICLGQQAIAEVFGGKLINLDKVYHGVSTKINVVKKDSLFKDLPTSFLAGRYHSWVVETPLPDELEATSFDEKGQLMSLRHKEFDVKALQYHPESILTPNGKKILNNWINS